MDQILSQNSFIVAYMHCFKAIGLVFATTVLFGFQADPWRANELFDAATIATELKSKPSDQPLILQVGFQSLYKSVRITHARCRAGLHRGGHRESGTTGKGCGQGSRHPDLLRLLPVGKMSQHPPGSRQAARVGIYPGSGVEDPH